ncbi:MAG: response regulator [Planctomycetes bacterium]|nr:response regulator [Planctomycetota bacterium]
MVAVSKRVLVVDDEPVVCKSFERVLTGAGFEVAEAHDGREALERIREGGYDVAVTDLKMPGMDGLQFVRKLRETNPGMSVVVVTGFPSRDTLREAARLGVVDYLTKPITPEVLTRATTEALTAKSLAETGRWPSWAVEAEGPPVDADTANTVPIEVKAPLPVAKVAPQPTPAVARPETPALGRPAPTETTPPSLVKSIGALIAAPFISLAYVLFLPFIGFAVLLGLLGKKFTRLFAGQEA